MQSAVDWAARRVDAASKALEPVANDRFKSDQSAPYGDISDPLGSLLTDGHAMLGEVPSAAPLDMHKDD